MIGNDAHKLNGNIRRASGWRQLASNEAVNSLSRESLELLVVRYDDLGLVLVDHNGKVWVNPKHGTKTGYVRADELK